MHVIDKSLVGASQLSSFPLSVVTYQVLMVPSEFLSEASEPDRKRPRIDDSEPSSVNVAPTNLTNHPTLYFGDGNVILRCQNTYFRVHRTLLTRNSPVFREIFDERDRDGYEPFRGCILLTLDDDADDMQQLLNKVYDGLYVFKLSTRDID
jgi:BTB/POZ domain